MTPWCIIWYNLCHFTRFCVNSTTSLTCQLAVARNSWKSSLHHWKSKHVYLPVSTCLLVSMRHTTNTQQPVISFPVPGFSDPVRFAVFFRSTFGHYSVLIRSLFDGMSAVRRGRLQGAGLWVSETAGQAHAELWFDGRDQAGVQPEVCPGSEDAPALQGVQVRPCVHH